MISCWLMLFYLRSYILLIFLTYSWLLSLLDAAVTTVKTMGATRFVGHTSPQSLILIYFIKKKKKTEEKDRDLLHQIIIRPFEVLVCQSSVMSYNNWAQCMGGYMIHTPRESCSLQIILSMFMMEWNLDNSHIFPTSILNSD